MTALQPLHVLPSARHCPTGIPLPTHAQGLAERALAVTTSPPYVQDSLAVDFAAASDEQLFGPQPTRTCDLPDPRQWAAHIAQALVEVMHGVRPPSQVMRWATPEIYTVVARRGSRTARRATRARGRRRAHRTRVTRVLICEPADDVVEASVVLIDGERVRALALRLVGRDGRWVVEALQIG
ncbi:Rv3235 family protein [Janibacter alittae]|uniref:Rv3235 family protein n=1 Tax=Janibacter alittae TaxID=3115209 RepID=A0ABZ2MER6_9MICO